MAVKKIPHCCFGLMLYYVKGKIKLASDMGDCKNNQGPTSLGSNCLGRGCTTILPLYVVAGGVGNIQQRSMFGFNIIGGEKFMEKHQSNSTTKYQEKR